MSATPTADDRNPVGWGTRAEAPTPEEVRGLAAMLAARFGADAVWHAPTPPPAALGTHTTGVPDALADVVTDDPDARRLHATGRSFIDTVALRETGPGWTPDLVATPRTPAEVAAVLGWCADTGLTCIPFGGGTSVVGGVDGSRVAGPVVTLQLRAMDRVLEIDRVSRSALVQSGASGPVLEDQLRPTGLTMRFYPQSFQMATLGGWIATRAAGHYATGPVHVDDLVEQVTAETPVGRWESRRLPGSGAGPSPDRMLLGSEGTLGVITQAWVRLQDRPVSKGSATVRFPTLAAAVAALAPLVQSGLQPSSCRVLDPMEAALNGVGDGTHAVMVLGAESPLTDVGPVMSTMTTLLADHGGTAHDVRVTTPQDDGADTGRSAGAEGWRRSFLRAPYLRDAMVDCGMVVETFETAMTFDRLQGFIDAVLDATTAAVEEVCGGGIVTCRITHAYPDGAAPYFTVIAPGRPGARVAQWRQVKAAALAVIDAHGGTVTHHHAVGRDHRDGYDRQRPEPFALALRAAKAALDPTGMLNPGVLLTPS